jgi:ParB family chromosome partitioning protein
MQILTIPLTAVLVEGRLRSVDPNRAAELAVSLREAGQITPIEVAPEDAQGRHRLIAGAHRVAAAKLAGMDTIRATVFDGSEDQARLREIDENLYRRELSPLDQAAFLAERRGLYERLFGPVKAGRRNRAKFAQLDFFDDVAQRFGLQKRLVQLALWRRNAITPAAWSLLDGSRFAEKGVVLDAIGKLPAERQIAVVELLRAGLAKTVGEALVSLGLAQAADSEQRELQALMSAWSKAGTKAQGEFLAYLMKTRFSQLSALFAKERKRVGALKEDAA